MLPTRLELRNFLAYRAPPPISFEGVDLACLSGDNGVGKSSLLDAITWALWGRARAKRDEELIHLGQDDMQVQLDFAHDGARFRVIRRRARSGRGSRGALDLLAWGAGASPRVINRGGIRRTQEQINELLRLEYETFANSAFLQQGRADAFTLKTAAERKRVLADILGLARWTQYESDAKQRLIALNAQAEIVRSDIKRINDEIKREPRLRAEADELTDALEAAQGKLDHASETYQQVTRAATLLRLARENIAETERLIASQRADMKTAQAEIERQDEKIAEYQRIVANADSIQAGYQQLAAAREDQDQILRHLTRRQERDQQIRQLERRLAEQRADITRKAVVIRERIKGLEAISRDAAAIDLAALQSELTALEALDARRDTANRTRRKQAARRAKTAARLESLEAEGRALNLRLKQLRQVEGPACPLCGQALTEAHREQTLTQLRAERDALRGTYRERAGNIRAIDAECQALDKELETWSLQLKDLPALQQRVGAAREQSRRAEEAAEAIALETDKLADVEARLSQDDYGREARAQLDALYTQVDADAAAVAIIKSQLDDYAAFERQHSQLELAQASLPDALRSRDQIAQRLENLRESLAEGEEKLRALAEEIRSLAATLEHEDERRDAVEIHRSEAQRLREAIAIGQQELNAIAAGRESKARLSEKLADLEARASLTGELRASFGKQGVPAMIIETVIPELEQQANDLLGRMSDGRMKLRLDTQRERVDGKLDETLDITIADELGARPYELYSGGEAFRINFAIRIALSKLLSRRAGAQLRALFIDEGFGSQDEGGRARMLDAIRAIKSDFDLILVITHIDELRDSFPLRLLVTKTADGSQVTIR